MKPRMSRSIPEHRDSSGWRAAQRADGVFISDYARDHPDREDIAESFLTYLAVRYRPERLTDAERAAILTAIPNRLIYFDEQGFDMSPYERRGSDRPRRLKRAMMPFVAVKTRGEFGLVAPLGVRWGSRSRAGSGTGVASPPQGEGFPCATGASIR